MLTLTPLKFLPQDRTPVPDCVTLYAPFWRKVLPNEVWYWNPWTGTPRAAADVKTDPLGRLIHAPGEELVAAQPRSNGVPSFDEWFKSKHGGASFDALYWQAGAMLADHVHALSREARAYLSEIAQGIQHG